MNGDGTLLTELFLGLVDLTYEVDEALSGFWNTLLRPVGELEVEQVSHSLSHPQNVNI